MCLTSLVDVRPRTRRYYLLVLGCYYIFLGGGTAWWAMKGWEFYDKWCVRVVVVDFLVAARWTSDS